MDSQETYQKPTIEVIELQDNDIITCSFNWEEIEENIVW